MGTGGTALNVQDPGADDNRPAQLADVADMARMVQGLENIHFYMLNIYPNDLEVEQVDVNRFGAALNRTEKHIMGGVYTTQGVRRVIPDGPDNRRVPGGPGSTALRIHGHLPHQPPEAGRELRRADDAGRPGAHPGGGAGRAPVRGHRAHHPGRQPGGAKQRHPGWGDAHPVGQPGLPGHLRLHILAHRPARHEVSVRKRWRWG